MACPIENDDFLKLSSIQIDISRLGFSNLFVSSCSICLGPHSLSDSSSSHLLVYAVAVTQTQAEAFPSASYPINIKLSPRLKLNSNISSWPSALQS
ncbi:hypothetical protein TorRG33x02_252770 [Trema orientale]|uniref:Uncharacterized protein n=1 Tax=Trema orientale TaxID=63057 RepID=A0A2P5DFV3_TREOI|nr:hypothetical protein TorRG33x02_252770 [Trema orientale]